jgi:Sortase domain
VKATCWAVTRHRVGVWRQVLLFGLVVLLPALGAAVTVLARSGAAVPGWVNPPSTAWTRYSVPSGTTGLPPPDRLRIPAIGVDTPLENLTLNAAGQLNVPADYAKAGWYSAGTAPGDVGPAVIAGHVDSKQGPAVFYKLRDLHPGDIINVSRGGTWLAFQVISTEKYVKTEVPTSQVYRPTPLPELRLLTCAGDFNWQHHSYTENLIVYAVATES